MEAYSSNEMVTLLSIFDAGGSMDLFAYFEEHFLTEIINSKMDDNFDQVFRLASVLVKHQAVTAISKNRQFFNTLLKYFTLKLYQNNTSIKNNKNDILL